MLWIILVLFYGAANGARELLKKRAHFDFTSIEVLFAYTFISFLMVTPLVWQATHDSLKSSCKDLEEMGRVFKMSKVAILFKIKLPASLGEIITSLVTGLGFAWKSGVAAEVLYSPNISIGKSIYIAKANLDFSGVYAFTFTVVILSIIIEILLKHLLIKKGGALYGRT